MRSFLLIAALALAGCKSNPYCLNCTDGPPIVPTSGGAPSGAVDVGAGLQPLRCWTVDDEPIQFAVTFDLA